MNVGLNIENLCERAKNAAKIAGDFLQNYKATVITSIWKDIKIDADQKANELIIEELKQTGIPILSEECNEHVFINELMWVVDPLDGSLNFFRNIPSCVVSIALMENNKPLLGVIYDFNRGDLYTGIVGAGAWLNGKDIHTSGVQDKGNAVMMTGFPSFTDYSPEALQCYIKNVQSFKKVRLIGSAALSLAYVASGKADAYYEKDIKIWDVAAGLALVKAAGGLYSVTMIDDEGRCTASAGTDGVM